MSTPRIVSYSVKITAFIVWRWESDCQFFVAQGLAEVGQSISNTTSKVPPTLCSCAVTLFKAAYGHVMAKLIIPSPQGRMARDQNSRNRVGTGEGGSRNEKPSIKFPLPWYGMHSYGAGHHRSHHQRHTASTWFT
uniref:Uncharacterized protein n=1 Tax=Eutreptiella gymnastica TaxID=73025 RepID=A0A7S1IWN3_9EUGL|mmetsp:Transcript_48618/g.86509  ORF Transcript_48618/g.86509 Transcript_48618/m.86509 type:complete len:135 (+) Transcript_48618:770-1174(+)